MRANSTEFWKEVLAAHKHQGGMLSQRDKRVAGLIKEKYGANTDEYYLNDGSFDAIAKLGRNYSMPNLVAALALQS